MVNSINNSLGLLNGLRIGITGGAGYLGRTIALCAAKEGAQVLLCGRTETSLEKVQDIAVSLGIAKQVSYQVTDVTSFDSLNKTLNWIKKNWGGIDGWVNNAAAPSQSLLLNLDTGKVADTLKSCLESVILATDLVAQSMISSHLQGSIVNIASMYGIVSPDPRAYTNHIEFHNPPAYGAAKAGIIQFSRYSACHLAPKNIRVNTVSPGAFPNEKVQQDQAFINELEDRIPMGRIGNPEEVAQPIIFLLSDKSSYITGHNLVVDGGWTAW